MQAEKRRHEERLKEVETKAIVRATNAEVSGRHSVSPLPYFSGCVCDQVDVLSMRTDLIVKPWEQRIREMEAVW